MMRLSLAALLLAGRLAAPLPAEEITYTQHVAPILWKHCAECHRPGEIGPFSLLTYQDAAQRADFIARIAQSRRMPPWKPDPDYSQFQGERHLSAEEIAVLAQWAEADAPEGDPSRLPPPPHFPTGEWKLGQPDLVLEMPAEFTVPADGPDVYRCFVIPIPTDSDFYVAATEFRSGNPRVVHHMTGYLDCQERARKISTGDGQPGFQAQAGSPGFYPNGSLGSWGPGEPARFLPDGVGRFVRKGADLVLTIHYHPSGKEEKDRSAIGVHYCKSPPRQITGGFCLETKNIHIPPGRKNHRLSIHSTRLPVNVDVLAVWPHMHLVGRQIEAWAEQPDGQTTPLVRVADWDRNWQGEYRFAEPVRLRKGTVVKLTACYDNSEDNPQNPFSPPQQVNYGTDANDEMCFCNLQVVTDRLEDLLPLADTPEGRTGLSFDGTYDSRNLGKTSPPPLPARKVAQRIAGLSGILLALCALAWWAGRRRPSGHAGPKEPQLKLHDPAAEAGPRQPHYPSLDVWRGLMCLFAVLSHLSLVLFYHERGAIAGQDPWLNGLIEVAKRMWCAVPILFVISGYCIAASCDIGRLRPAPLRSFFSRRVRRVCLPFWIFLLLIIPIVWTIERSGLPFREPIRPSPNSAALTMADWLRNFTLTDQFGHAVHRHWSWLPQTWTLAYEVQFYIVCGLLLAWPKRFFRGAAIVSGLTLGLAVLYHTVPEFNIGAWFFDGHWLVFAAGIGLYYQFNYAAPLQSRFMSAGWLLMGAAALAWRLNADSTLAALRNAPFIAEEFVAAAGFVLLALATRRWDRTIAESRLARPLAFVGQMGYSVYLVHWQIIVLVLSLFNQAGVGGAAGTVFVILPLGMGLSLLVGWVFYQCVERRFMNGAVVAAARPTAREPLRLAA